MSINKIGFESLIAPMKYNRFLLVVLVALIYSVLPAQDFSNKGKEFWIAYPAHIDGTNSVMGLYITSETNTTGTVQLGSGSTISFTVQANIVTRIFLNASGTGTITGTGPMYYGSNKDVYLNMTDGSKTNAAIRIATQNPVVVYSHIIRSARSGATLALPTTVLGNEYIAPSMNSTATSGATADGTMGGVSELVVVATQDNTTVEITPTAAGRGGKAAGSKFSVTLAKAGDCYQFQSVNYGDLSGSRISSKSSSSSGCKPIAVFSATTWSSFDCSGASGGDNLYQQLFPTRSWGKTFVTAPFINRPDDIFRIYVQNGTTTVQIKENGVTTTLGSGAFNSTGNFYTYRTNNPIVITGSDPISVVQYITSQTCKTGCPTNSTTQSCFADPEMVLLNPVEQTLRDITFFSAHSSYVPQGQTQVALHFVNIIISKNHKNTLTIDNVAPKGTFVDIPGSNYAYLQEDLTASSAINPVHRVLADTNFAAIVYGYGGVESYGYNGGTNVRDFTSSTTFQNPYGRIDSAVTCVNTPLQLSVPLNITPASITWDFSAAPNISPNTKIGPLTTILEDSSDAARGLKYYSPGKTFTFTNPNSAALRDTIKLYTTSATPDGCGSTDQIFTIPVTVKDLPVARFTAAAGGCANDPVTLTDQSTATQGTIKRWFWDFGDGTTADLTTATVPPKVYNSPAAYTIKLKAVSDIGCLSAEVSQTVQQSAKPVANFSASTLRCIDKDVVFTDASTTATGTLAKWTWDLADGKTVIVNSSNAAVTTQYTSDGVKAVSLKVATTTGCESDPYTPAFAINPSPKPGFTLPEVCLSDAFAVFTDTSKIADGSEAQFKYQWNFNAGTPAVSPGPNISSSTLKNPQIKYAKSDVYKVSLTLTSKDGCVASMVQDFTVNGSIPKAAFDFANAAPYCGVKPVKLRNNSTVDFGGVTRLEIYWDFANAPTVKEVDENPVPGKIYPHSYPDPTAPKTYTIRLVAYSGGTACVDATTQTITVYPQPKAAFNVSASQLCYGDIVNFTDKSYAGSSAISKWVWDLGGGASSAIQNPNKQFNDSGSFMTRLYFFNNDGCISDTATQSLTVYPNPKLLLPHMITVLAGGQVTLTPTYVFGNELSYLWTPPTYLSSDTAATPKAIPDDDITYQLKLTARGGCSVTDTIFIRVLKRPEVPNAFSPNGDGIHDTWKIKYLDGYPGATIDVYNRYGQIVFRSLGYDKEWDGTRNGNPLPVGTYYYIINPRNGRQIITGSVTLIK